MAQYLCDYSIQYGRWFTSVTDYVPQATEIGDGTHLSCIRVKTRKEITGKERPCRP